MPLMSTSPELAGIDAAERVEQSRFALAASPENADELPALDFEIDVLKDAERLAVFLHLHDEVVRGDASEVGLIDPDDRVTGEFKKIIADTKAVAVNERFAAEELAVEFGAGAAFVDDDEIRPVFSMTAWTFEMAESSGSSSRRKVPSASAFSPRPRTTGT